MSQGPSPKKPAQGKVISKERGLVPHIICSFLVAAALPKGAWKSSLYLGLVSLQNLESNELKEWCASKGPLPNYGSKSGKIMPGQVGRIFGIAGSEKVLRDQGYVSCGAESAIWKDAWRGELMTIIEFEDLLWHVGWFHMPYRSCSRLP